MTNPRTSWFRHRHGISWLEVAIISVATACIMVAIVEAVK